MLSVLALARKSLVRFVLGAAALGLAACTTGPIVSGPGPATGGSGTVTGALLVPGGSGQASDELLARSLEFLDPVTGQQRRFDSAQTLHLP